MRFLNRRAITRAVVGMIPVAAAVVVMAEGSNLTVKIRDDCDPATFNAALQQPGKPPVCVGNGETTINEFVAQIQRDGKADDWRFNPDQTGVHQGTSITLQNRGGETHTFTRVQDFGGGFVSFLDQLTGLAPRPECAVAADVPQPPGPNNIFVPAGMVTTGPTLMTPGTYKFQCCIHPWMRSTITVK